MRVLSLYASVILTVLFCLNGVIAVPHRRIDIPEKPILGHHNSHGTVHKIEDAARIVIRAKSAKSPPKTPSSKPTEGTKPGNPSQPQPKSTIAPARPTDKSPAVRTSSSVAPVKFLPFSKEPRPTKAIDICDLPGFDCVTDIEENFSQALKVRNNEDTIVHDPYQLERRSSPRTYSVVVGAGTPTMMMTSLPYPLEAKLFPVGSPSVIMDFETDDVRNAKFRKFTSVPKRTDPSTYIVEHIVEVYPSLEQLESIVANSKKLQSIMLFIKAAVREAQTKGIKSLSEHVDISFFTKHWGTSTPQVQQQIAKRPTPFPGYDSAAARSSLNDLIFEAMGSKTNTHDFVLCEEGVNSMKAKLWSHINPFGVKQWQTIAKDASDGSIPRNRHLAVLRSVLGVQNYMNTPDVVQRLQETVRNVKIELGNFKFITGEDVRNTKGNPVDLPALWVEFMDKQLQKFTEDGTKFVKDQVDFALPKYKAHLEDLRKAEKRILDEEASKNTPKGRAAINLRAQEHNALNKELPAMKAALSRAESKLETAKKAVEAAKKAVDNAPVANKSALMADQRAKNKVKIQAAAAHYKALSAKGRQERDIIKLRQTDLAALIKDVEADIKQMTDYRAAAVTMKAPKAE